MLSGVISSWIPAAWRSILLIRRTFNSWVCPPRIFFAGKAGGQGDISDNLNTATPSCQKVVYDALTISPVCEMYFIAAMCLFWAKQSFCMAYRFRLRRNISEKSWTLAILYRWLAADSLFISMLFLVYILFNAGLLAADILLLIGANCCSTTVSQWGLHVVFDFLQPISSHAREKLASTLTPCCLIENLPPVTLERSNNFDYVSTC